jgi:hypothetical protein
MRKKRHYKPTDALHDVADPFPGLRLVINNEVFKKGRVDKDAQAFTFSVMDDAESIDDLPNVETITNRSFTIEQAKKLISMLEMSIDAVKIMKEKFSALDEIECYLDSMKGTVDDFKLALSADPEAITDSPDLDSDLRDLEELIKNF